MSMAIRGVAGAMMVICGVMGTGAASANPIVATSPAGYVWTADAAAAYVEALNFSLAYVGVEPLSPRQQQEGIEGLARVYASMPDEAQVRLANARPIWNLYRFGWNALAHADQQEFVFGVLAIAVGDRLAHERVYGPAVASGAGGGGGGGGWDGNRFTSDGGALVRDPDSGCTYVSVPGGGSFKSC